MDFLKNAVQQKLKELYLNNLNVEVDALSKCLNYRVYKKEHKLENYFVKLQGSTLRGVLESETPSLPPRTPRFCRLAVRRTP